MEEINELMQQPIVKGISQYGTLSGDLNCHSSFYWKLTLSTDTEQSAPLLDHIVCNRLAPAQGVSMMDL